MSDDLFGPISRRRSLALLASAGGGLFLAKAGSFGGTALAATSDGDDYVANVRSACMLTAEQEEGPYYVAVDRVRADIIGAQKGIPFRLEVHVINSRTCKPLTNAAVDVWHCNAAGLYSDKSSQGTIGQTWLRGVQFTDAHGLAVFHSVYPGHYNGRTTHVHVKVHTAGAKDASGKLVGGHVAHTGNLFPPEAVNSEVYELATYRADTAPILTHAQDMVYSTQHGYEALMTVAKVGNRLTKGLVGRATLAVNPTARPALIGIHS
jgi:protocatechuate 3,4-dioxygenase beta subunit